MIKVRFTRPDNVPFSGGLNPPESRDRVHTKIRDLLQAVRVQDALELSGKLAFSDLMSEAGLQAEILALFAQYRLSATQTQALLLPVCNSSTDTHLTKLRFGNQSKGGC